MVLQSNYSGSCVQIPQTYIYTNVIVMNSVFKLVNVYLDLELTTMVVLSSSGKINGTPDFAT